MACARCIQNNVSQMRQTPEHHCSCSDTQYGKGSVEETWFMWQTAWFCWCLHANILVKEFPKPMAHHCCPGLGQMQNLCQIVFVHSSTDIGSKRPLPERKPLIKLLTVANTSNKSLQWMVKFEECLFLSTRVICAMSQRVRAKMKLW